MSHYQGTVQEGKLVEEWHTRQLDLANVLQTYGLLDDVPHVDWSADKIKWEKDEIVVTARTRQLCRYSPTHKLVTIPMPNNDSLLPTSPEYREESNENGAWLWAMKIAEAEKAEYVYRLRLPYVVLFMGLWDLQVSNPAGKATLASSAPDQNLLDLLQELRLVLEKKPQDAAFVSRFFGNHGETMLRHAPNIKHKKSQQRLEQIGKRLKTISQSFGQPRFGLFPPAPLSEGKVEELKRELTSIQTDILSN